MDEQSKSFRVDTLNFDELPPQAKKHFVSPENKQDRRFVTPGSIIERVGINVYMQLDIVTWPNNHRNKPINIDLPLANAQKIGILSLNKNKGLKQNCLKNRQTAKTKSNSCG